MFGIQILGMSEGGVKHLETKFGIDTQAALAELGASSKSSCLEDPRGLSAKSLAKPRGPVANSIALPWSCLASVGLPA